MSTIRQAYRKRYSSICNDLSQDNNLSLRARGLMLYFLSLPDDWEIHVNHLVKIMKEGRHVILTILKELRRAGYVHLTKKGFSSGWKYWVFETPISEEEFKDRFSNYSIFEQFEDQHLQKTKDIQTTKSSTEKKIYKRKESPPKARDKLSPSPAAPPPNFISFGEYKRIQLTQAQYDDLVTNYGKSVVDLAIEEGDCWLEENGKKKKSYKAFLQNWIRRGYSSKKACTSLEIKEKLINKNGRIYNSIGTKLHKNGTLKSLGITFHIAENKLNGAELHIFKDQKFAQAIAFKENGFKDQFMNALVRCGYGESASTLAAIKGDLLKKFVAP